MSSVVVTRADYHADYAWWGTWYVCPECKSRKVRTDYRYCPNCGAEIDWRLGEDEVHDTVAQ